MASDNFELDAVGVDQITEIYIILLSRIIIILLSTIYEFIPYSVLNIKGETNIIDVKANKLMRVSIYVKIYITIDNVS